MRRLALLATLLPLAHALYSPALPARPALRRGTHDHARVAPPPRAAARLPPTFIPCDSDADGCLALCDDDGECSVIAPAGALHRLKLGFYFGLWFLLSVCYSIANKRVNNLLPGVPCSVASATVAVGSLFVGALWLTGLRSAPRLSPAAMRTLLPIGICHAMGHMAGTVAVAAGTISFTQIVKAANPVYVCLLSATLLRQAVSRRVWLSLTPIVAGVALATVKEVSFVKAALLGAAASDLAMALRNVLSKRSMASLTHADGRRLGSADMFGLLTLISTAISLPIALAAEGRTLPAVWTAAAASSAGGSAGLLAQIGWVGLFFYAYNEVAMKALSSVHAVTHAVGNILRRVVIMLVSMVVFGTPMTPLSAVGSGLAIGGSYLYALTKHREKLQAQQSDASSGEAQAVEGKLREALPLRLPRPRTAGVEVEAKLNRPGGEKQD